MFEWNPYRNNEYNHSDVTDRDPTRNLRFYSALVRHRVDKTQTERGLGGKSGPLCWKTDCRILLKFPGCFLLID